MSGLMVLALALGQSVSHGLMLEPDNGDRCGLHK